MKIRVLYSCLGCGVSHQTVEVDARTNEDVVTWMEKVMSQAIGSDHSRRSPHCSSRTMANVKIPITGAEQIGGPSIS